MIRPWTWFEPGLVLVPVSATSTPNLNRQEIQRNLQSDLTRRTEDKDWKLWESSNVVRQWLKTIKPGVTIGLYPNAEFPKRCNYVEEAEVELWCRLELERVEMFL